MDKIDLLNIQTEHAGKNPRLLVPIKLSDLRELVRLAILGYEAEERKFDDEVGAPASYHMPPSDYDIKRPKPNLAPPRPKKVVDVTGDPPECPNNI